MKLTYYMVEWTEPYRRGRRIRRNEVFDKRADAEAFAERTAKTFLRSKPVVLTLRVWRKGNGRD